MFSTILHLQLIREKEWMQIKDTVNEVAESVLGKRRGTKKDRWILANTWRKIDERRELKPKKSKS